MVLPVNAVSSFGCCLAQGMPFLLWSRGVPFLLWSRGVPFLLWSCPSGTCASRAPRRLVPAAAAAFSVGCPVSSRRHAGGEDALRGGEDALSGGEDALRAIENTSLRPSFDPRFDRDAVPCRLRPQRAPPHT